MNRFWGLVYPGKLSMFNKPKPISTTRADVLFVVVLKVIESVQKKGYKRVWLMGGGFVASSFIKRIS